MQKFINYIFLFKIVTLLFLPIVLNAIPPKEIPIDLFNDFTLNGAIPVTYKYFNDFYPQNKPLVYTHNQIEENIARAKSRATNYYGMTDTYLYQALDLYISAITNKDVAVIGSVLPWYESILLAYNARPTTIEYNKIVSYHPRLKTMTVKEYEKKPKLFDAILSVSSIEHDGLGRYGDPINPNGDIFAMEKIKKMLKKGGLLFLAVPIGKDLLVWNAHRIYGQIRLPALLEGWEIIDSFGYSINDLDQKQLWGSHQPIFVLREKSNTE